MLRRVLTVGGCVAALAATSCTHYVHRAESAYEDGRYLEAAEDLAAHEQEVSQLPPAQRAQYGVYRGLSLLELGEIAGAERWLRYSAEVEQQAPGSLAPYQRLQLDRGMAQLEKLGAKGSPEPTPLPPPPGEQKPIPLPAPTLDGS
jgi:hypothetical protein